MGPVERQGYAMNAQLETDQSPETPDEQSLASSACSLNPSYDVQESSNKAERFLLNYTASGCWEQMERMEWTTYDVHEMLSGYIRENAESSDA